jgi:hypothetical protein
MDKMSILKAAASPLMNFKLTISRLMVLPCLITVAIAQTATSDPQAGSPVSYASVSALNMLLSQLDQASKSTQTDLAGLRIERWKTDSNSKRQLQGDVDSIRRNLREALPAMVSEVQASPENLPATFKLYRNLDALYDVFTPVVESAGAFGSKDDFQALATDLDRLEKVRRSFADRMGMLTSEKESELSRLRVELQKAQAAAPPPAPKKVIVDDTEPVKKAVSKKKTAAKKSTKKSPKANTKSNTSSTKQEQPH